MLQSVLKKFLMLEHNSVLPNLFIKRCLGYLGFANSSSSCSSVAFAQLCLIERFSLSVLSSCSLLLLLSYSSFWFRFVSAESLVNFNKDESWASLAIFADMSTT